MLYSIAHSRKVDMFKANNAWKSNEILGFKMSHLKILTFKKTGCVRGTLLYPSFTIYPPKKKAVLGLFHLNVKVTIIPNGSVSEY